MTKSFAIIKMIQFARTKNCDKFIVRWNWVVCLWLAVMIYCIATKHRFVYDFFFLKYFEHLQFNLFSLKRNSTCFTSVPMMSSLIGLRQWSYKKEHFSYYVYSIKRSSNSTPSIINNTLSAFSLFLFWFSFYSVRSVAHLIVCLLFCEPFSGYEQCSEADNFDLFIPMFKLPRTHD